jgi:CsoR family transcriptional regulator, copper-sensing transcriptional repressor
MVQESKEKLGIMEVIEINVQKEKALIGCRKAQSLLTTIVQMLEKNEYCIDIMQQNLSAIGLLKSANQLLMEGHLNDCFRRAVVSGDENREQEMIREILQVVKLSNK